MRISAIGLCLCGLVMAATSAQAQVVTGLLGSLACSDKCYVSLHDDEGKRILFGLCEAAECRRWVRDPENAPKRFVGKKVKVRIRAGDAPDPDGKPNPEVRFIAELSLAQP